MRLTTGKRANVADSAGAHEAASVREFSLIIVDQLLQAMQQVKSTTTRQFKMNNCVFNGRCKCRKQRICNTYCTNLHDTHLREDPDSWRAHGIAAILVSWVGLLLENCHFAARLGQGSA